MSRLTGHILRPVATLFILAMPAAGVAGDNDNDFVPDSYIVTFVQSTPPVITPGIPRPDSGRPNPPPFGEHSTGQDKSALAATLGINGCVAAIFESINAAHLLMGEADAERLRRHPLVASVSQNRRTSLFSVDTPTTGTSNDFDGARYDAGHALTIPRVDTAAQVGAYRDARFCVQEGPQNSVTWKLIGVKTLDSPSLARVPIRRVDVVRIGAAPVAIYLRTSTGATPCHNGPAQVAQRLVGNRFEISISAPVRDATTRICDTDARGFSQTIALQVYGLGAGTYFYDINGVSGSFRLDSDNKLPEN